MVKKIGNIGDHTTERRRVVDRPQALHRQLLHGIRHPLEGRETDRANASRRRDIIVALQEQFEAIKGERLEKFGVVGLDGKPFKDTFDHTKDPKEPLPKTIAEQRKEALAELMSGTSETSSEKSLLQSGQLERDLTALTDPDKTHPASGLLSADIVAQLKDYKEVQRQKVVLEALRDQDVHDRWNKERESKDLLGQLDRIATLYERVESNLMKEKQYRKSERQKLLLALIGQMVNLINSASAATK